ncbi:MAG: hypothetical protein J6L65_09830 [Lachnospiraceae bacterium]|nr:hypothetical protein [Lachnospiraceae bacterium]
MRRMNHLRAGVLALRLIGVILVIFNGLNVIRCLLGMIVDKNSIAYMGSLIGSGLWLLVGIGLMIVAGIIKKKHIK